MWDRNGRVGGSERAEGIGEMATDREREREAELESAMYTNCLLLGLDPSVLGVGQAGGGPSAGHFRHSNPKLGEQLLYFLLCGLRGSTKVTVSNVFRSL